MQAYLGVIFSKAKSATDGFSKYTPKMDGLSKCLQKWLVFAKQLVANTYRSMYTGCREGVSGHSFAMLPTILKRSRDRPSAI